MAPKQRKTRIKRKTTAETIVVQNGNIVAAAIGAGKYGTMVSLSEVHTNMLAIEAQKCTESREQLRVLSCPIEVQCTNSASFVLKLFLCKMNLNAGAGIESDYNGWFDEKTAFDAFCANADSYEWQAISPWKRSKNDQAVQVGRVNGEISKQIRHLLSQRDQNALTAPYKLYLLCMVAGTPDTSYDLHVFENLTYEIVQESSLGNIQSRGI